MKQPMRLLSVLAFFALLISHPACAQVEDDDREWKPEDTEVYEPVPPKVSARPAFLSPPSDAIVLFDGTGLSEWESAGGGPAEWIVENGVLTVKPGTGNIATKRAFGDVQLYLEWRSPSVIEGEGQGRGNSGVFLQRRYEVQVLDAYSNETYVNGMAGSVYKQHIPLANPAVPPGEWQTYNIIFEAPEFDEHGEIIQPAFITVIWNGVPVQVRSEIEGHTRYIGLPEYSAHGDDNIMLQDHSNPVSYRNIWIRELSESPVW